MTKPKIKKSPKPAKKLSSRCKTPVSDITLEQQIVGAIFLGKVEDYFVHLGVMTLTLEAPLSVGDMIRVKGHATDLTQKVETLQIAHENVSSALSGEAVGIRIADRARPGDAVYKC